MFSPNASYGRLVVERYAVFNANLNRISGVKFIRAGAANAASKAGSKSVLEAMTGEPYLKQRGGLFMFFDINSPPPGTSSVTHGSWNLATLKKEYMINVGSVDDRKIVYDLRNNSEL